MSLMHYGKSLNPCLQILNGKNQAVPKQNLLRSMLNGILYRHKTGCQWALLPREFGSKTAVHEFYQKLNSRGVFRTIVAIVAAKAAAAGKYLFTWQSMDGVILQAPARVSMNHDQGFGANPTDRGRKGSKLHLWCAQNSLPISVTVHGANVHDSKLVIPSFKNAFIDFEVMGKGDSPNNICMDKAYDSKLVRDQVRENGMIPHIWSRGEEIKEKYDTLSSPLGSRKTGSLV